MTYIPRWKLIILLVYSCTVIPMILFLFGLFLQWLLATGNSVNFFGAEQLYIALKMAVTGVFLGGVVMAFLLSSLQKRVK
ncbi:hypothetical protein ACU4HD_31435 [Cupriavidus basilensis]